MNMQNVSDVYPLSPLQRVMLLHEFCLPESRANFVQTSHLLRGSLQPEVLKSAWQQVVARHAVLRTLFLEEGLDEPLQVVCQQVELPWIEEDWRAYSDTEQKQRLQVFLREDYTRGISLTQAPLMRLSLIRLRDETYHFTWSLHHLILDGWSSPVVLSEVLTLYEDLCQGRASNLPEVRPYRDYIAWLLQQDNAQAERVWRATLKGFVSPTLLQSASLPAPGEEHYEKVGRTLSFSLTTQLQDAARQYHVTLNTLLLGAWALLLGSSSTTTDVVFGATVSGRPDTLPGVESMVGMFINIVPVRVEIPRDSHLATWLQDLQARQTQLRRYEYCSLLQIREWSEVPWSLPLFESLLVFENYPPVGEGADSAGGFHVHQIRPSVRTNYPLTLVLEPQPEFTLHLVYDTCHFTVKTAEEIVDLLNALLTAFAQIPHSLTDLLAFVPDSMRLLTARVEASPVDQVSSQIGSVRSVVAPRNTLEIQLVRIWEKLLGMHPISVTDQFFALGGQSLLAIRLRASIQNQFGRDFPLSLLFQGGTIAQLATYLQEHTSMLPQSPLVAIQPYGDTPPLFCLHPALGNVFCYYHLSRYLRPDLRIYALQDLALETEDIQYLSLEELARCYLEEMRSVQPQGPYLLCGFSLGGLIAFEIAQQLQQQGQEVALLAILDSGIPAAASKYRDDAAYLAVVLLEFLRGSSGHGLQELYEELLPLEPEERIAFSLRTIEAATGQSAEVGEGWLRWACSLFKQRIEAVKNYTMRPYAGQITLFCASERDEFEYANRQVEQAEDLGWSQFSLQPLALYRLPGHHDTLLDDPVITLLADQLQRCLAQAITGSFRKESEDLR
ncbi:MAG TPA: condensation domain-containing protein [Ktedonobacteraceae bacterium]|jgi:thioesterase domain-containing protein/acyl carrier protein